MTWRVLIGAFLLLDVLALDARAERLQVCAFGFHGTEELAEFASHLPPTDFEFIDLSPPMLGAAPSDASAERGWLQGVCRQDLRCEVVVYSGEFAGRFFGRCGRSLSLQAMEEASCQARCDGLFHTPREVFLLACNTLATKDEDLRTPAIYLQVLLDHGFDQASAERVVAMRYGPLGPTFREALRRIFMGVPRIYGFSSVAPLGRYTGPMLDRYFRTVGDYRRHLEQVSRGGPPNRALAAAFAGTSLVETSGLSRGEPAAADRDLICALYDERQPVARRLEIVRGLVARPDVLSFVPSIQVFIDRHPEEKMSPDERRIFEEVKADRAARDRVVALVHQLDVSALKLELGHFAVHMGWMTQPEFRALAIESVRQLLRRPLTNDVVDVMCEVPKHESVGDEFTLADLPGGLFRDPEGIRFVSCLAPPGDAVSERFEAALDSVDPELRLWAAHALSRRLPLSETVLLRATEHLGDPSPDVRLRLEWIFRAQRPLPRDVQRAVARRLPALAAEMRW
ncbi:MAG: hypothetical protein AB1689_19660 [Thermodesulfobacteriota bacterium]